MKNIKKTNYKFNGYINRTVIINKLTVYQGNKNIEYLNNDITIQRKIFNKFK